MRHVSSGKSIPAMRGGRDGRSYSYISDVSLMADGVKLRTAVQRDGRFYCEPEAEWRK